MLLSVTRRKRFTITSCLSATVHVICSISTTSNVVKNKYFTRRIFGHVNVVCMYSIACIYWWEEGEKGTGAGAGGSWNMAEDSGQETSKGGDTIPSKGSFSCINDL